MKEILQLIALAGVIFTLVLACIGAYYYWKDILSQ